jgi:hypothetical protein
VETSLKIVNNNVASLQLQASGGSGRNYVLYSGASGGLAVYDKNAESERLRIDSAGRVGIGTSSPISDQRVTIVGSAAGSISLGLGSNANFATIQSYSNSPLHINALGNNTILNPNTGNVGIGTTSPNHKLDVQGGNNSIVASLNHNGFTGRQVGLPGRFMIGPLGNGYPEIGYNFTTSGGVYTKIGNDTAWRMAFGGGNAMTFSSASVGTGTFSWTDHMRITSAGNVGIGVTNPQTSLDVYNTFRVSGFTNNVVTFLNNLAANSTAVTLRCQNGLSGGTTSFLVRANGNVENTNNSYGAISDAKVKENIKPTSPKLDKLMQVEVVNYNLIDSELKQIGVVSQQLETIFPSLVQESDDFEKVQVPQLNEDGEPVLDEDGNPVLVEESLPTGTKTKSVKYSVFVPILIKAMQEQQAIIESQQKTIESLEQRIQTLEGNNNNAI